MKVLDAGHVELVEDGVWGTEMHVFNVARGCTNKEPADYATDATLHKFFRTMLHRNPPHVSPFEFCGFTVHIKAPIFVARQLHRHRVVSIMERSLRYTEATPEWYVPDELDDWCYSEFEDTMKNEVKSYEFLRKAGVKKEQARGVLGTSLYTEWYLQANLREWMHIINLRADKAAQNETQQYAFRFNRIFYQLFPNIHRAWVEAEKLMRYCDHCGLKAKQRFIVDTGDRGYMCPSCLSAALSTADHHIEDLEARLEGAE